MEVGDGKQSLKTGGDGWCRRMRRWGSNFVMGVRETIVLSIRRRLGQEDDACYDDGEKIWTRCDQDPTVLRRDLSVHRSHA